LGLFYTKDALETFFEIFEDLQFVLTQQGFIGVPSEWDTSVEKLSLLIKEVKNQYTC
jgi:ssDNA-specific exonuclease RecJ